MKPPEVSYNERFSERLRAALLQLGVREGRAVGWAELGRRVKERTGRVVTAASVNRWGSGSVPDLETIAALAAILGVRAGFLAFGEEASGSARDEIPDALTSVAVHEARKPQGKRGRKGKPQAG